MHGCGNDFVVIDQRTHKQPSISIDLIKHMSDRHTGIGCDQFIVLKRDADADVKMDIFNTDGSTSAACGNATRCVASILFDEMSSTTKTIRTNRGILECRPRSLGIEVDMGTPMLNPNEIPVKQNSDPLNLSLGISELGNVTPIAVGMGNPHCVLFVDKVDDIDLPTIGPKIETHDLFPTKTNVEFVEIIDRSHIKQRTWERGVGETLACGSGACAVAVAGVLRGLTDRRVKIDLRGGTLSIEWRERDGHVLMTGPTAYVFEGEYPLEQ